MHIYALAAALVFGLASPSIAGKRHRGHHDHSRHYYGYAAAAVLGLGVLSLMRSPRGLTMIGRKNGYRQGSITPRQRSISCRRRDMSPGQRLRPTA